ncbi:T9SS type A sorting domain-containing protein [Marixanthomonas spongiae]|uniref:Secretion system C-terminal sorting domain-containing protein n=1 Tax=Marixanthomonas spongiae TaxID=2174845 RepID=A0A2U0I8J5_9FLAO|nr:T9SS type A sorting domain-containing protein [Marixanthomonas spongiae]PVW17419.1 hypothetical protein DDV96_02625 [Marixanthomonas spongiae]
MKRLLLLLIVSANLQGLAQEPLLFQTDWYLHSFTYDGVEYDIPANDPFYSQQLFFNDTNDGYQLSTYITIETFSASPTFEADTFTTVMPTITLFGCEDYCDLEQAYLYDFFFREGDPYTFTYTTFIITDEFDEVFELYITDQDGNLAVYRDTPLLSVPKQEELRVSIYPNPVKDQLFFKKAGNPIQSVSIVNLNGQKVLEFQNLPETIDISSLSSGVYFVEITSEDGSSVQKFIKN